MVLLISPLLIVSCNPVKQVLKDKVKFDKVAEEVIRRGYCVNDTIVEIVTDTVYKTDSLVINTVQYKNGKIDTVFADGSALYMDEAGNVSVKCPVKKQVRTVKKTETIRDRSLENILKRDIFVADSISKDLRRSIEEKNIQIQAVENKLVRKQLEFYSLIVLLITVIAVRLYKRFRNVLPF